MKSISMFLTLLTTLLFITACSNNENDKSINNPRSDTMYHRGPDSLVAPGMEIPDTQTMNRDTFFRPQ